MCNTFDSFSLKIYFYQLKHKQIGAVLTFYKVKAKEIFTKCRRLFWKENFTVNVSRIIQQNSKEEVYCFLFIYQLNIRVFLSHDNSWNETGLFVFLHLWESMRYWVMRPQANLTKSPLKSSHWRRNTGPAVLIMRAC